jgi:MFS family permease
VGSWFGAFGMQSVIFSWLVVWHLQVSPEWVGVAQTTSMLPSLALLLLGGATADRHDPRRLLILLHALATLPPAVLALAVATGRLSLGGLLLFALCMGTLTAFTLPARDALLSRVAGDDMLRAVTGMTATQFGAQALGALAAGAARWVGGAPMLLVQGLVLAAGSLAAARVHGAPAPGRLPTRPGLHDLTLGLRTVARDPGLRGLTLCLLGVGLFFIGPFLVTFPLLVHGHYGGDVTTLSIVFMLFPVGTITGSLVLRARGVTRKGRAALLALASGATTLGVIGLGLPLAALFVATFCWGLAGSVFINCSRTLLQEAAPPAMRGRVLSVFQLCFMGAAPVGSLCAGFCNGWIGPLATLQLFACAMLTLVVTTWVATPTSRLR